MIDGYYLYDDLLPCSDRFRSYTKSDTNTYKISIRDTNILVVKFNPVNIGHNTTQLHFLIHVIFNNQKMKQDEFYICNTVDVVNLRLIQIQSELT